jgi:hypothetical protein
MLLDLGSHFRNKPIFSIGGGGDEVHLSSKENKPKKKKTVFDMK